MNNRGSRADLPSVILENPITDLVPLCSYPHLLDVSDGDRQMVDILFAAHEHNIDVVDAACAENLDAGWPGCGLSPTVLPFSPPMRPNRHWQGIRSMSARVRCGAGRSLAHSSPLRRFDAGSAKIRGLSL